MTGTNLYHAPGLHLHQLPGNLELFAASRPREAEQIVCCYKRAARYASAGRDAAKIHLGFSGILLEQLLDSKAVDAYRGIVGILQISVCLREAGSVELVGIGCYHPVLPLIPRAVSEEQMARDRLSRGEGELRLSQEGA